jgi:hypothetical protein
VRALYNKIPFDMENIVNTAFWDGFF